MKGKQRKEKNKNGYETAEDVKSAQNGKHIVNGLRRIALWAALAAVLCGGCRFSDLMNRSGAREINTVEKMEVWLGRDGSWDKLADQTEFTISLASAKLAQSGDDNVLLSPVSLCFAFAAVLEGADGATAEELKQFLQIWDVEDFYMKNKITKQFLNTYFRDDEGKEKLTVKDSVWIDDDLKDVKQEFLDRLGSEHFTSVFHGDQGSEATVEEMNRWVEEATKGLIKPEIKTDPERMMMLMNALYMKLGWALPFEEEFDQTEDFHTAGGTVKAQFMNQRIENVYYTETERYRIASLEMEDGVKYRVLLPKEGVELNELLEEDERQQTLRALLTRELDVNADIQWSLPKHTMEQKSDLKDLLQSMGYNHMFSNQANFSKISTTPLKISASRQLTKLIVDHDGVEAAAYTEVEFGKTTAALVEERPQIEMKLNRPYLFVIEGPTDLPLFIGAMTNPIGR